MKGPGVLGYSRSAATDRVFPLLPMPQGFL